MKLTMQDAYGELTMVRSGLHAFVTAHPTLCVLCALVAGSLLGHAF